MAFNPQIIPATDFSPNIGVGVGIPFSDEGVFTSTYTSGEAVKSNLINFFLTEPGERFDNPTFGGGFRTFLFQQIAEGTLDDIQDHTSNLLGNNFPQVRVNKVEVNPSETTQAINVSIYYSLRNQPINDVIEINFG
jgi:phage baseplate assembly protein W